MDDPEDGWRGGPALPEGDLTDVATGRGGVVLALIVRSGLDGDALEVLERSSPDGSFVSIAAPDLAPGVAASASEVFRVDGRLLVTRAARADYLAEGDDGWTLVGLPPTYARALPTGAGTFLRAIAPAGVELRWGEPSVLLGVGRMRPAALPAGPGAVGWSLLRVEGRDEPLVRAWSFAEGRSVARVSSDRPPLGATGDGDLVVVGQTDDGAPGLLTIDLLGVRPRRVIVDDPLVSWADLGAATTGLEVGASPAIGEGELLVSDQAILALSGTGPRAALIHCRRTDGP